MVQKWISDWSTEEDTMVMEDWMLAGVHGVTEARYRFGNMKITGADLGSQAQGR